MAKQDARKSRLEQILDRSTNPILVLAALAVILYVLELFRVVPPSLLPLFLWANFIIDLLFLIDLVAKCVILGRNYLRSPWFFIDLISTLPIISSALELLGAVGPQLQATRVARGARVARIARVARVARLAKVARVARLATAIRARRGLTFLKLSEGAQETPAFNRSLFIGVPALLLAFILASTFITKKEVDKLLTSLSQRIEQAQSEAELELIQQEYDVTTARNPLIENIEIRSPLEGEQMIPVSLSEAYAKADRLSGILLLLVLLTIGISVYISGALARDRSKGRERSILSQCFSPPIVQKFYEAPEVIERFYHHWMTIFFIDIRGFTEAFEKDAEDVEGLALKLRQVMDTARNEIVVTHEGVIDKFMGDAVMGWVGGHFSIHWNILHDVRQQLCLDELELTEQDIKSIQREIRQIDSDVHNDHQEEERSELESTLQQARHQKKRLKAQQEQALKENPGLWDKFKELSTEYRHRVAKSAVTCCLRISQEVEKIKDPEAFHELKIGIGSGEVLVGNFGSTDQIGFTVLGPTVNRSARLEPASAQSGCKILLDQTTYELLKEEAELRFRRIPPFTVKGISETMITYEPFFADEALEAFLVEFELGVKALEDGKNERAIRHFTQANTCRPGGDAASQLWIAECELALKEQRVVGIKEMSK